MTRQPTGQPRGRPRDPTQDKLLRRALGTNTTPAIKRTTGANRLPTGPGTGMARFLQPEPSYVTQARPARALPAEQTKKKPLGVVLPEREEYIRGRQGRR